MQGQGENGKQKHITKKFLRFHNYCIELTIAPGSVEETNLDFSTRFGCLFAVVVFCFVFVLFSSLGFDHISEKKNIVLENTFKKKQDFY